MTTIGLTARQSELLAFVREFEHGHGFTPSYAAMKEALGLSSASSIHRLVCGLEERGYVSRIHGRARCLKLLVAA